MQKRSGFDNTTAELNGTYVDLTTDQTIATGNKTFRGIIKWRANDTNGKVTVKSPGDVADGVFNLLFDGDFGYIFHLTTGPNAVKPWACIGIGVDNDGVGIHVGNKKTGYGVELIQYDTITSATAYGFRGTQQSTLAPMMFFDQQGAGVQPIMRFFVNDAPAVNQVMLRFGGFDGDYGFIYADGGRFEWTKAVTLGPGAVALNAAVTVGGVLTSSSVIRINNAGTGFETRNAAGSVVKSFIDGNGAPSFANDALSTDVRFISVGGARSRFGYNNGVVQIDDNGTNKPVVILSNAAERIRVNGTGIGLYGVTPVARAAAITSPTAPGAAYVQAEAAAMKTAVDAIRVALTNIGVTS